MLISAVISGLLLTLNANCQEAENKNVPNRGSNYFPYEHIIADTNQTSYNPLLAILGNLSQAQNGSDTGFIRKDSRHSDIFMVGRGDGQRTTFGTYENKGFFAQTGFDKPRSTGNQLGTRRPQPYYSIGGIPVPVVQKNNSFMDTNGSPKRPEVNPSQPENIDTYLRPPTTPYPIIGAKPVGVQSNTQNSWSKPRPGHQGSAQLISSSPDTYTYPNYGNGSTSDYYNNNNDSNNYYAARPSIGGHPVDLIHHDFKYPLNQNLLSQGGASPRIGGRTEETERFGWQVSVFSKEVTPYVRVCGGSIVTSTVVISAAQCFWGVGALPASQFAVGAVALERLNSNTTADEYSRYLQKSDVSDIKIPPRFRGLSSNNQADIAVLLMGKPFSFHQSLKPVCVNFDNGLDEEQLRDGNLGTVLGTGSSGIMLNHNIPIISVDQCLQETTEQYLNLITSDKICAGVTFTPPDARLCNHDIGSGLFSTRGSNPVPFLRGVASTPLPGSTCSAYSVNLFTRLQSHMTFLLQHVPNIEKECWNHYPSVSMILNDRFGSQNEDREMYEDEDGDDGQFVCNCYC